MSSIQLDYSDITDIFKESRIFRGIMFGMRRKLHILLKVFY